MISDFDIREVDLDMHASELSKRYAILVQALNAYCFPTRVAKVRAPARTSRLHAGLAVTGSAGLAVTGSTAQANSSSFLHQSSPRIAAHSDRRPRTKTNQ